MFIKKILRTLLGSFVLLGMVWVAPASAQPLTAGGTLPLANESFAAATGSSTTLSQLMGEKGLVVAFWSNVCPWIDKYERRFIELAGAYQAQGFGFVLVNPNDPAAYPEENLQSMQERFTSSRYEFPYLQDQGARLARAFGAERTPQIYVFNGNNTLAYSGAIDDSPAVADRATAFYVRDALDAIAAGQPVSVATSNAIGCTIKFP